MMRGAIVDTPIDVQALIAGVQQSDHGAIATFLGTVRDTSDGRSVTALEYSAYETMAERELARIVNETNRRWPESDTAIVHRVGLLQLGDIAVAVVTGHPHRAAAFEACRYAIDALKQRVPIWKQEHYADGTREWIDPTQLARVTPPSP
jgi:molybdopterin synthase catalytic subunit